MEIYALNNDRMLCWDEFLVDKMVDAEVIMHHPRKTDDLIVMDEEWEGAGNGAGRVFKVDGQYRFYYRAYHAMYNANGTISHGVNPDGEILNICLKTSVDGKHFKSVPVNKFAFNGSRFNNIVGGLPYLDENPDCLPGEKYKALTVLSPKHKLGYCLALKHSEDGIVFSEPLKLEFPGGFDSENILLWNKDTQKYNIYYRGFHYKEGYDAGPHSIENERHNLRDVRLAETADFIHFDLKGPLDFGEDKEDMQLYTNNIMRYHRAKNMFIALPARYHDRWQDAHNLERFSLADRKKVVTELFNREGTALTDCAIMTSRDGFRFNRWDEAFITPGVQDRNNWWYGQCFPAYGIIETECDEFGAPNELSFFMNEYYKTKNTCNFRRYAVRLDGFFSWYAKYKGGEILTKPFTFTGRQLEINFATPPCYGGMRIQICDENGKELEGYDSRNLFGDSVDRIVDFEKDAGDLQGTPIRLKIQLKDSSLYSFRFI